MILFPTLDEALLLHAALIERFGGSPGVRDLGLLDSALHRPQSGYYEDIIEMAAALFESLSQNPFVDGNKSVAFFLMDVFLRLNGWRIEVTANAGHRFIVDNLERRTLTYEKILAWLRSHIRPLTK